MQRELHLTFHDAFRAFAIEEQAKEFGRYIDNMNRELAGLEENDPNRPGMMMILQVAEQMFPYINSGDVPMQETIVVEIQSQSPLDALLNDDPMH